MSDPAIAAALTPLGFDDRVEALFRPHAALGLTLGRVIRVDRGSSFVFTASGHVRAEAAPDLVRDVEDPVQIAVGDWVVMRDDDLLENMVIDEILPRRSVFTRGDPGKPTARQVVAANVDTVFLVHALGGDLNLRRLERELVLTWESGAQPVVVLTKADLLLDPSQGEATRQAAASVALDVPIHVTSVITGLGIEELAEYTTGHRTVALLGASGVGKSTLLNLLAGEQLQKTKEVRAFDDKGRHTTVARELFPLPSGGVLIDTPGLRALALWDADSGLAATFPDIVSLISGCRFADCKHRTEPGCAVTAAIEAGSLPRERLESYLKLQEELDDVAEQQEARIRNMRDRRPETSGNPAPGGRRGRRKKG